MIGDTQWFVVCIQLTWIISNNLTTTNIYIYICNLTYTSPMLLINIHACHAAVYAYFKAPNPTCSDIWGRKTTYNRILRKVEESLEPAVTSREM